MAKQTWKINQAREADDGGSGVVRMTPNSDDDGPTLVGKLLRARREEAEQDLHYVSQMLRIRRPYLEAIEDGRVDDLPGPTYAVGFVRAYAEHLGLDPKDIISRFKEDAKVLEAKPRLVFPAPLPEGKIPSGAIVLIAVIMALVVYGGWIQLSSQNQSIADFIPQLPDRLAALIGLGDGETEATPQTAEKPVESDVDKPVPAAPAPAGESGSVAEEVKPAAASDSSTAAATPSAAPAPSTATPTDTPAAESPIVTTEAPATDTSASSEATTETASATPAEAKVPSPAQPETTVTAEAQAVGAEFMPIQSEPAREHVAGTPATGAEHSAGTVASMVAVPPDPPTDEPRAPRVFGLENAGARIVIRAITDSWVEIRDASGALLLTRVLRVGDTYRVPDRSGLSLVTGNAGGLEFIVDDEAVPALGPIGSVRRNVSLDPALLKAGQAYIQ